MHHLTGVRVAILATDLFEESELVEPKKALEQAGAKTVVIAPKSGSIQGVRHIEKASQVQVDLTLEKAEPGDFDAVLLPGGASQRRPSRPRPARCSSATTIVLSGQPARASALASSLELPVSGR